MIILIFLQILMIKSRPTSLTNATRALYESGLDERRCWSERNPSDFLFYKEDKFADLHNLQCNKVQSNPTRYSKSYEKDVQGTCGTFPQSLITIKPSEMTQISDHQW